MKIILLLAAVVVGVLVAGVAGLFAVTFAGLQDIRDGYELNGVRVVKDSMVSFGIVDAGAGGVVLIDAGNDAAGQALLADLARRGLGPDAVQAIFLTHGHRDHTAAAALFPKAEIMALAPDVALAEGRVGSKGPITRFMPVKPTGVKITRVLHDGETVTVGTAAIRVFAIPGHTAGSAAYLVNGVLFLGDAANAKKDGRVVGSSWAFSESQAQDRASLVRLQQMLAKENADVKTIVFAHSGVLTQGLAPLAAFAGAADR
jgi:glyoxylase-like metal-dependent hydrolase (beta-lactamase superfamily II)